MSEWKEQHDWRPWTYYQPPPRDQLCWFMRDGWDRPVLTRAADTHPLANAEGLYWRPWEGETIEGEVIKQIEGRTE